MRKLLLLIIIFTNSAFGQVSVNLSDLTVLDYNPNIISVSITNLNTDNIRAIDCMLYYDTDLLKSIAVERNENSVIKGRGFFISKIDTINGFIDIAWADAIPIERIGNLFNIYFTAKKPGNTKITSKDPLTRKEMFIFNNGNPSAIVDNAEIEIKTPYVKFVNYNFIGNQVELELRFINMLNVGSFSFRIFHDQSNVTMTGIDNIYKNISLISNSNNGVINLGWYDATAFNPLNIIDGKICTIKFIVNNLSGSLRFDSISEATNDLGKKLPLKFESFNFSSVTDVNKDYLLRDYELRQNYPNPFNPLTTIKYSTPNKGNVKVSVFNLIGEEIEILMNEELPAGEHTIQWNAANLSSGVYFYSIKAESSLGKTKYSAIKKMLLLK
ncbi:MAG: hypothetical protein CVV23_11700 [Ignavibacteriae bacterium HGW-Ignavibacteriae-2]|jgi:hypothetical protein|nr:MAG: hypothetical protein CVV23_11700 [Ignavibacteriae bacterium HGW-Ignavibacteriae-2]